MPRDGSRLRPAAVALSDEIPARESARGFLLRRGPQLQPQPQPQPRLQSQSRPHIARRPSRAVRYAGVPA